MKIEENFHIVCPGYTGHFDEKMLENTYLCRINWRNLIIFHFILTFGQHFENKNVMIF